MSIAHATRRIRLSSGAAAFALGLALATPGVAHAQATSLPSETPEQEAGAEQDRDIVVTGSRIARTGFDQPTPTTVIGDVELRQGQRPNLQQVLNDSPQFRPTTTTQVSVGNTSSGNAPVDLRGLGAGRTLTLVNGRRFVGNNNLNYVPVGLVDRVEVVTGGATAAKGSDAIAGVVNILLKDRVEGVTIGGITGISSRGDGFRYGGDLTAGTSFADGRGQLLFAGEYVNDEAIRDRNSRRNLGSAAIVRANPASTTDLSQVLQRDVNFGNQARGGLITTGVLAGQFFQADGTLAPFRNGVSLNPNPAVRFPAQVIGGADAVGLYDAIFVTTPLERISSFGRASYDFGGVELWADATYGRSRSAYPFLPDIGISPALTIQANNPFLSQAVRNQLAAAGQTSFTLGRFFDGEFAPILDVRREQIEGAIGIAATLGGSWRARAHYSHGEVDFRQRVNNARVVSRFNNAINAVSAGGQIVCAINADANAANDDPACRPLNLFGVGQASPEALAYIRDTQANDTVNKLDAALAEVTGDLFSLWGKQPISIAVGAEARFEEQTSVSGALDLAGAFGPLNLYGSPINGGFNVKEGFGEVAVPLFATQDDRFKVDLNGAARYSDYSRSGGIWSWKAGGTVGLFDALMVRATRSRDIRAPTIGELFAFRSINIGPLVDQDSAGRAGTPGYNPTPQQVTTFSGGNQDLVPEIGRTTTVGATFSPRFVPGLNISVDYYDIAISGAITTLSGSNLTLACRNGAQAACDRITRDATGTVVEVRANSQNLAEFTTSGFDIEASYLLRMDRLMSSIPGTLRVRALATHVREFVFDTGVSRVDTAGDLGSSTANAIPKWRGLLSFTYQDQAFGLDARLRYVGSGKFNQLLNGTGGQPLLINNDIAARAYLDLGAQFKVDDRFTLSANVNNVFDRDPPISPTGPVFHDAIGTYFTLAARATF